jgi:large subunit ribosomal protein L23
MSDYFSIIRRPVITERATRVKADFNQYVLEVAPDANKQDIRTAVERLFKVKVESVRTVGVRGKFRRLGAAIGGYRPRWKKAYVTLKTGQEIKVAEDAK